MRTILIKYITYLFLFLQVINLSYSLSLNESVIRVSTEEELDSAINSENTTTIILTADIEITSQKNIIGREMSLYLSNYSIDISTDLERGFLIENSTFLINANSTSEELEKTMNIKGSNYSLEIASSNVTIEVAENSKLIFGNKINQTYCSIYAYNNSNLNLKGNFEFYNSYYSILGEEGVKIDITTNLENENEKFIGHSLIYVSKSELNMNGYIYFFDNEEGTYTYLTNAIFASESKVVIKGTVKLLCSIPILVYGSNLYLESDDAILYPKYTGLSASYSTVVLNSTGTGIKIGELDEYSDGLFSISSQFDIYGKVDIQGNANAADFYDELTTFTFHGASKISFKGYNDELDYVFDEDTTMTISVQKPNETCQVGDLNMRQFYGENLYNAYVDNEHYCSGKRIEKFEGFNEDDRRASTSYYYDNDNTILKIFSSYPDRGDKRINRIVTDVVDDILILNNIEPREVILFNKQNINLEFKYDNISEVKIDSISLTNKREWTNTINITEFEKNENSIQVDLEAQNSTELDGDYKLGFNFGDGKTYATLYQVYNDLRISKLRLDRIKILDSYDKNFEFNYRQDSDENEFLFMSSEELVQITLAFNDRNLANSSVTIENNLGYEFSSNISENLVIINGKNITSDIEFTVKLSNGKAENVYKFNLTFFELTKISPEFIILTEERTTVTLTYNKKLENIRTFELVNCDSERVDKRIDEFTYNETATDQHEYTFELFKFDRLYGKYAIKTVIQENEFYNLDDKVVLNIEKELTLTKITINGELNYFLRMEHGPEPETETENIEIPFILSNKISNISFGCSFKITKGRFTITNNRSYEFYTSETTTDTELTIIFNEDITMDSDYIKIELTDTYIEDKKYYIIIKTLQMVSIEPNQITLTEDWQKIIVTYNVKIYGLAGFFFTDINDEEKNFTVPFYYIEKEEGEGNYSFILYNGFDIMSGTYKAKLVFLYGTLEYEDTEHLIKISVSESDDDSGLSKGVKIAIGVSSGAVVIIIAVVVFIFLRLRKRKTASSNIEVVSFIGKGKDATDKINEIDAMEM